MKRAKRRQVRRVVLYINGRLVSRRWPSFRAPWKDTARIDRIEPNVFLFPATAFVNGTTLTLCGLE